MCEKHLTIKMGFTDEEFPVGSHMCLIYSNEEERKKIISKYLGAGNSSEEKVAYFADEMSPEEIKKWLSEMGISMPPEDKKDSFSVTSTADTYHPDGTFNPSEMLDTLKVFYKTAKAEGYTASRVTGEMSWALKEIPSSDRLMEYEARVNDLLVEYPVTAICQYDARKFDGATILQCLKVHPYMIVHGQIVRNPYYMKTEDFLKEYSSI